MGTISFHGYIIIFSEYIIGWAQKKEFAQPQEKHLNDAVSEQTSYARKKIKKMESFSHL